MLAKETDGWFEEVKKRTVLQRKDKKGVVLNLAVVEEGTKILGTNFFTGQGLGKLNPNTIADVATLLDKNRPNGTNDHQKPGLYCIAVDQKVIGPYTDTHIDITSVIWKDDTTDTNKSSIACIIAWDDGRISHYFGGDLSWKLECLVVRWLNRNEDTPEGRILTFKASHHGSCSSTPPRLITAFRPVNIIVSAASKHNHPDWELVVVIDAWLDTLPDNMKPKNGPFLLTCFPYWLQPKKKLGSNMINFELFGGKSEKIAKERVEKINGVKKVMGEFKSTLYRDWCDYYTKVHSTKRPAAEELELLFKELRRFLKARDQKLFRDVTRLEKFTKGTNSLQWVCVSSVFDIRKDAKVSAKAFNLPDSWSFSEQYDLITNPGIFGDTLPLRKKLKYERRAVPYPLRHARRYPGPDDDPEDSDDSDDGIQPLSMAKSVRMSMLASSAPVEVATSPDFMFSFWGSIKSEESQMSTKGHRLDDNEPLDDFVCDLHSAAIRLAGTPNSAVTEITFDEKDSIAQWMGWALQDAEVRLKATDAEVSSLTVRIKRDNTLFIFDTAQAHDSLTPVDPPPETPGAPLGTLGLMSGFDNSVMIFGLSTESELPGVWTMKQICELFNGLGKNDGPLRLHPLALLLLGSEWILDTKALGAKRNALWFTPCLNYKTVIRLAFVPNPKAASGPLKELLGRFWPKTVTVQLKDVHLVTNSETYIASSNESGTGLISTMSVKIFATVIASINRKNSKGEDAGVVTLTLPVAVELTSEGNLTLTVQSNVVDNDFGEFTKALIASIVGESTWDLESALPEEFKNVKENIYFRRIYLTINEASSLLGAGIDLEIKMKMGKNTTLDPQIIAMRLGASYNSGSGGKGGSFALSGGLWFPFKEKESLPLYYFSDYEEYEELTPITKGAAKSLWLPGLVIGDKLPDLPDNVPQYVTRAEFFLNPKSLSLSGVVESCKPYAPYDGLPEFDFKEIDIDVVIDWSSGITASLDLQFRLALTGPPDVDPMKPTCTNELVGMFHYETGGQWDLKVCIQELKLGLLYEYFERDTQGLLYDILKEIDIRRMEISYEKSPPEDPENPCFKAMGDFLIAERVSIKLTYRRSKKDWTFSASVKDEKFDTQVKLIDIVRSVFGAESSVVEDLPDFLANAEILGPNSTKPSLSLVVKKNGSDGVQLLLSAGIGSIEATFIQFHSNDRAKNKSPAIRYFQLTCGLPNMPSDLPLLNDFKAPFDKLGFLWANQVLKEDALKTIQDIQKADKDTQGPASETAAPKKKLEMKAGFHFAILSEGVTVLDYPIGKTKEKTGELTEGIVEGGEIATIDPTKVKNVPSTPVDEQSPKAPLKKTQGSLTISDVQLHYKGNKLGVKMDAVFAMGPLMFALLGFELTLEFEGAVTLSNIKMENLHVGIEGLAASFKKPPLTIEGALVHMKDEKSDMYAGGITIGFVPWLFQAAGFYGKTQHPDKPNETFTSALVYAILRGPLITLEFATISGITGGFGYNVGINMPRVEDVYRFPFLAPSEDTDIVKTLDNLMKPAGPDSPRWFFPQDGAMWLAAGLTVTAFEMLDVTAVLVAQWSPQIQFHVLGLAVADIPNAKSPFKLAHVELGFKASIDMVGGLFSVEAQLSPNSYILDPNCHLSGGFALYYWFKTTESGREGDWVFTIGGYHSAYQVPLNYPRPPRLAISWSLGDALAIKGEAYFAITPKACMAGLHINAVLTLGPLRAWFDAYADFLINYAPFKFVAVGHVSVGVSYNMDIWFIHVHIGVEIGATLQISGPPIAGTVHVDFWVFGFDIAFGNSRDQDKKSYLALLEFYELALGASAPGLSPAGGTPKPHVYACFGGLVSPSANVVVKEDAPWDVRAGPFVFGINALFAIGTATVSGIPVSAAEVKESVYAKPMHVPNALTSDLNVVIKGPDDVPVNGWRSKSITKSVPRALWGQYDSNTDPTARSGGNNSISDLLAGDNACVRLMMGVEIQAPQPHFSEAEALLPFDVELAMVADAFPDTKVRPRPLVQHEQQNLTWTPAQPLPLPKESDTSDLGQWGAVRDAWSASDAQPTVDAWAKIMNWKKTLEPKKPRYLAAKVDELYLEAPHFALTAVTA
ncbi:hypothetical protein BDV95DRAFT_259411 [Massariosphaeria phaeospora]|uniref:DUF6603 domain-containing protein n=1 Tax=Massariosphaeria phaeospora TaxID=100035 RepID=A0A7C8HYQ0_9PLEO|nr:hypothetical protein BDV95DRAFT_259411 [Massariosphaeria phaeospora]